MVFSNCGFKPEKDFFRNSCFEQGMKRRDGPTGFAVFPVPKARLFFWNLGFR
jgi:hypothetical protein